jgi:hypothetical protein
MELGPTAKRRWRLATRHLDILTRFIDEQVAQQASVDAKVKYTSSICGR